MDTVKADWKIIKLALLHSPRTLLVGRPGTGKTTTAVKILREGGYATYVMSLTEGDFSQSVFGRERLDGKGGMEFIPSPAIIACREAAKPGKKAALVLNEINRASLEVLSALYPFCDVGAGAELTLPNNEILFIPKDFRIVATMNGDLEELPEGLRGRFPVAFEVNYASPDAIKGLPKHIQKIARAGAECEKGTGVRIWHAFMQLSESLGSEEEAAKILWGPAAQGILDSFKVASTDSTDTASE